jgi:hypothetical protein
MAKFRGDRKAWHVHLNSLEPRLRFENDECWGEASIRLEKWRMQHPNTVMYAWSRDVTRVLIEMADWGRTLKAGDMEELKRRILELNHSVLAWFN